MSGGENFAKGDLKAFAERLDRLTDEKRAITDDIAEVLKEAKGQGFDTKILRKAVTIFRQDRAEYKERQEILELYLHALGVLD